MNAVSEEKIVDSIGVRPALSTGKAVLNLGCGAEVHPACVNVDICPGPGVIQHDLRQGIPFRDASYDLVYHSRVLNHLRPNDALRLMRECRRVLRPGGVLRVVDVDLEQMCRVYLQKLEAASRGDRQSGNDHEWMLLELYDQATREYPGGRMAPYLGQDPLPNERFIYWRTGLQGRRMVSATRSRTHATGSRPAKRHLLTTLRPWVRKLVLTALLGPDGPQALEIGRFRLFSGQVSHRFYDRYSLKQLFLRAGLTNVSFTTAKESYCSFWHEVNLDISPDGVAAKPHVLIMEGVRAALEARGRTVEREGRGRISAREVTV